LQSFAAVAKADPLSYFRLVLEGPLNGDLQLLCCAPTNRSQQQKNVALWINVCRDAGLTKEDARSLASRLFLESISEHEIIERLRNHVSRAFEVNSTATELYLAVFVARFLEWAARRGTIDRQSIDSVRVEIGEHIAREQVNQAVGRGLLQRVNWACDGQIDDFYEGKATRPGHIAASVDVLRPSWLTRIKEAFIGTSVCVLRASSGQGKSTLLFRYAHDHGPRSNTYLIRSARTPEEVAIITEHLRYRSRLSLPILVLIDGADWRTRLWSDVAELSAQRLR
jgi:hypothetical protein